jgi:tRNA pseudouridine32 synthase / 23S rRNA pseudouridine746 synthase
LFVQLVENKDFIAVDKPAGWLSTPSRLGEKDPRHCLGVELQKQLGTQLFPVHRLDEEVSGVMLFARNAQAHKSANLWFESRSVHKTYEALTSGVPDPTWDVGQRIEWKSLLLRGKKRAYESPHGKESITIAIWKGEQKGMLTWILQPLTGRPHQIRVELARHGFPILGDELYGSKEKYLDGAIALRAVELDFTRCPEAKQFELPDAIRVQGLTK